jgi:hypothetical protein
MANYIAHYTKKLQICAKREEILRRIVKQGGSKEKIVEAVEELRAAWIRVLKARQANLVPDGSQASQFEEIDKEIQALLTLSLKAFLAEYGMKNLVKYEL